MDSMQDEYWKYVRSMELMRRRCTCTFRQRELLIWMANDDHVSVLRCLSVQLVGYVTAFPAVNGVKKLEWQWCGLLAQSRWMKHKSQTSQHYRAFMLLEARVQVTCLWCTGERWQVHWCPEELKKTLSSNANARTVFFLLCLLVKLGRVPPFGFWRVVLFICFVFQIRKLVINKEGQVWDGGLRRCSQCLSCISLYKLLLQLPTHPFFFFFIPPMWEGK